MDIATENLQSPHPALKAPPLPQGSLSLVPQGHMSSTIATLEAPPGVDLGTEHHRKFFPFLRENHSPDK